MSAHTPGPWMASTRRRRCIAIMAHGSARIADVHAHEQFNPSAESNARLIAAAPDLLAVLRLAVEKCSKDDEVWLDRDWVHRALDVIAKAEHGEVEP